MLQQLRREYKVRRVACEGGAELFRSLLELDLVDQLNVTIAPFMFGGANAPTLTGLSKEFLPTSVHCSLERNAHHRRRMFFDLPDQTSPLIPRNHCGASFSRARPPNEFTATIRTDILHLLGALRTKSALIDANECRGICRKGFLALFAAIFHFQRHFDLFSLRDGLSCGATNLTPSIRAHRQLDYHSRAARNDL